MSRWKRVVSEVRADVCAARDRDPAAQGVSTLEILSSWAGVQALLAHRAAHALLSAGVPVLPRVIAYMTRAVTGVEIHPAAVIGREFFVDHGAGDHQDRSLRVFGRLALWRVEPGQQPLDAVGTGLRRRPTERVLGFGGDLELALQHRLRE